MTNTSNLGNPTMVKFGFKEIAKRKLIKESPVGSVGRTTGDEADIHINNNSELKRELFKIVKKLGGKTVVKKLLESKENPETYLIDSGYKIKYIDYKKDYFEIEFYRNEIAKLAFEDLKTIGFNNDFSIELSHKFIILTPFQ